MPLALGPNRCCESREAMGLPLSLNVALAVTSSTDEGMPSDEWLSINCGEVPTEKPVYAKWSASTAFIDLIGTLPFTFTRGPHGGTNCCQCCFTYHALGTLEPCVDYEEGDDWFLLGQPPWEATGVGASYQIGPIYTTGDVGGPGGDDASDPADCTADLGYGTSTVGTERMPLAVYAKAALTLCIFGNRATAAIGIDTRTAWRVRAGDFIWNSAHLVWPDCDPYPEETIGTFDETCEVTEGHIAIYLEADLLGVPGVTIWDKIKNATWTGTFEYGICGIGGGCTGYLFRQYAWCWLSADEEPPGDDCGGTTVPHLGSYEETDAPVHQECLYGVGELTATFS